MPCHQPVTVTPQAPLPHSQCGQSRPGRDATYLALFTVKGELEGHQAGDKPRTGAGSMEGNMGSRQGHGVPRLSLHRGSRGVRKRQVPHDLTQYLKRVFLPKIGREVGAGGWLCLCHPRSRLLCNASRIWGLPCGTGQCPLLWGARGFQGLQVPHSWWARARLCRTLFWLHHRGLLFYCLHLCHLCPGPLLPGSRSGR